MFKENMIGNVKKKILLEMLKRKQCWKYFKENIAGNVLRKHSWRCFKKHCWKCFKESITGNVQ